MKLILAEKPSVAQDIAKAFSKVERKDGYIKAWDKELGEFCITWCFGHLFEIDTEKIAPREEKLPFPERFEYRLKKGAGKQFKVIKELVKKAEEVWNFGDPEREGELLIRLVLLQAGWKKWDRTYRMWTSKALTPDVVKEEIKAKRPAKNYDSVYWEALARQHSDWLVGIPLSRVLIHNLKGRWSVGRVQTPTLVLLVQREVEIKNFKPEPYVVIKGVFSDGEEDFEALFWKEERSGEGSRTGRDSPVESDEGDEGEGGREEGGRISPPEARRILEELEYVKEGKVERIERELRKQPPPLLHSLTTLQQEASKLYGFSAQKTLDLAQKLYEKKLLSYPRTESQHLSEKDRDLAKKVLAKLGKKELLWKVDKVGKRVFDDSKLTDHFALIPLAPPSSDLSGEERKIYDLVWRRFVGAFMDYYEYEETKVNVRAGGYLFRAKGKRVVKLGWKELYGEEKDILLPSLSKGQVLELKEVKSEKKLTQPPPRYTEGSLIKKMKKLGLGTAATRSSILESLKRRGYVYTKGKQLIPTEKGVELVKKLLEKELALTSPEMTAEWEKKLREIRERDKQRRGYEEFVSGIKEFVKEQARELEKVRVEVKEPAPYRRKNGKKRKKGYRKRRWRR